MFSKPYILFCPHSLENFGYVGTKAIDDARTEVLTAIQKLPKHRFIIKMHPSRDDSWFYRQWMEVKGIKNCKLVWREDTKKLIKRSRMVIVQHSSVALEALALKKPVIVVEDEVSDALGEFDEFPMGTFLKPRHAEDIIAHVRSIYEA